jgi:Rps23 Pro-64 3,4-dihydroxylase Tpa1-like proline 4-hydroxylase
MFGQEWCNGFRNEIKRLYENDIMYSNATHVHYSKMQQQSLFIDKRNIYEMELIPDIYDIVPDYLEPLDTNTTIIEQLNVNLREIELNKQAIKLQYNAGEGGCFPIHSDSDPKIDPRIISSILYLNPEWKAGDGGELKLYPFPNSPVVIEPKMDRLVLFSSSNILHRVLPSLATERICLTLWYSGRYLNTYNNDQIQKPLPDASDAQVLQYLSQSKLRKHVAKLVYADEWAQSIRESHEESDGRQQLLETHWRDVQKLQTIFQDYTGFINELKGSSPTLLSTINNLHGLNWL